MYICNECKKEFKTINQLNGHTASHTIGFKEHFKKINEQKIYLNCRNCNKIVLDKRNIFCSRACASIFNGKKRKKTRTCKVCKIDISNLGAGKGVVCNKHNPSYVDWSKVSLKDCHKNGKNGHRRIRDMAKNLYGRERNNNKCEICQYDKQIDVCHIKSVKDFNESTPISIVNHIDNLIGLCKRCHWEFDNGYIDLDSLKTK